MEFTDKRAKEIADAEQALQLLQSQVAGSTSENIGLLFDSIRLAVIRRDAAYAMEAHTYECAHCRDGDGKPEVFTSAARMVKIVTGIIEHGEDGSIVREIRFAKPRYEILCSTCQDELKPIEYLTQRWSSS